jgi:uncharacterized protein YkwD
MNAIHAAATLFPLYLLAAIVQVRDVSGFPQEKHSITSSESSRFPPTASAAPSTKEEQYSHLVNGAHRQVNDFRRAHGLKPFSLDPIISAEAREHSGEMARRGKSISHRGFNQRVEDILKKIPYRAAAENVGFTIGHEDPARTVVEGWRKSPEHRKNMLGAFSLTGIGVAQSKNGGYFFTQIFIEPLK